MNAIKRKQFTDRLIKFTQSVYKIDLIQPSPPLPVQLSTKFPKENVEEILKKKKQIDQLINSCLFYFDNRYQLMVHLNNYITKSKLSKSQSNYLFIIVLRSCCGLLCWELVELDVNKLLVFIKLLCQLIPHTDEYKQIISDFFTNFTEIIYKLPDMDTLINYLPLINEMMLKCPKICGVSPILHLETIIKICHRLDHKCSPQSYNIISIYLKNFSRIIPFCVGIDFSSPKEKKSTEIIQLLLQLVPKQATINLLTSYLALLMAFHKHDADILPLLERISNGFIEDSKQQPNEQQAETPPSSNNQNLNSIYTSPANFVLSSNQIINLTEKETFPSGLNFDQIERPVVPNLNGISPNYSKPSIVAASEMSEHFLNCGSNEFLSFVKIMLNSQSKNILSLMIMMIISLPPHRSVISQSFSKDDSWSVLFNEQNFSLTENSKSRVVNLKQSIFDLISFLSIDKAITSSVRVSYCNLLARFAKNPKFSAEILLMSFPQLKEIFSLPNIEDNLVDILMQILLNQQRFHMSILTQSNTGAQIKSIVEYRVQTISIIFKIIKLKEIMLSLANSQFACEALFSMILEKSLESLIEKVVSKLMVVASFPKVNHHPFTTALHQLILILMNQIKSIELLCNIFKLIENNSTSILLKSSIMNDVYNAILLCKDTNSPYKVELLELSLKILKNVKGFVEFDPRIVPFRTIGKVCSTIGLSETIFEILVDTVINDEVILIPEGVQMLMVATEGTETANYVLKYLIELCKDSVCNRCSCIVGNTPILLISSFKFTQDVFELMRYIFYSIADAQSIWAFMRCFDQDSTTKEGILSLLDIVENATDNVKPLFQFTSVSARICFPQISSSSLQNGIIISSTIFIDSKNPGRDFFEFRNNNLRFVVSFTKGIMLYRVESKKGAYSMPIEAEFPVKKWFDIVVLIKPSDGITILFDGDIKAGLGVPSFTLGESNFDSIFFQRTDTNNEATEPMQMNNACISGDFAQDEIDISSIPTPETIKNHTIYKISADNIYEGSLVNMQKLSYNAFTIPVASSFFHVFESTYSLKIILSLFRKIERMPSIIDNLIKLVFKLINHSLVIGRQMIDCNGFGIIANFLSKLDSSEITIDRWKLFLNEAKYIRSEPIMKAFAQDIFYNLDIWIKGSTSLQYLVLSEWKKCRLYDSIFQNVPFLLSTYEKFMNEPVCFKSIQTGKQKRGSQSSIKFGYSPNKLKSNTESTTQSDNDNSSENSNLSDNENNNNNNNSNFLSDNENSENSILSEKSNLKLYQSENSILNDNESENNSINNITNNNLTLSDTDKPIDTENSMNDFYNSKSTENETSTNETSLNENNSNEASTNETNTNETNLNENNSNEASTNDTNLNESNTNDSNLNESNPNEASTNETNLNDTNLNEASTNDGNLNDVSLNESIDSENNSLIENDISNSVESNNSIDIDSEINTGNAIAGTSNSRTIKSLGTILQSSLPSNFYQRSRIRNSICLSNSTNEKPIRSYQPIRSIILAMLKNYILKFKVNNKDARFIYQSLYNCPTPEITIELLDVIDFIITSNFSELLNIEGSEWLTFFVHKSEAVQIRWLSLFVIIYPQPSPELTKSVSLLLISQQQRREILDNDSSKYSILCAYCKACLYLNENIDLSAIIKHQNLCACPQYFHMAVALAIDAPNRLSDLFVQFILSLCRTQDNIDRIAETSTPLTLFILIYWAINRSLRSLNNNNNESESTNNENNSSNNNSNNQKAGKILAIQSIDKVANKFISLICSESTSLFETAIGIIDSISLITRFDLINFRSLLLSNVFAVISKRNLAHDGKTKEFIRIICQSIFFHVKIYTFLPLQRLIDDTKTNVHPPFNKRKKNRPFPDLQTLCGMYKDLVTILDSPLFSSLSTSSTNSQAPLQGASSSNISQFNGESIEAAPSQMSHSPSLPSSVIIQQLEIASPAFGTARNPSIAFSLAIDRNGNWIDRNLAFKLILFMNKAKDESMRKTLIMLTYFFFRISNLNDAQAAFPIVAGLLRAHDAYSFLIIKALMKFKIFSVSKGDDIAGMKPLSQGGNTTTSKRKKKRRYSDSTAPPAYISDIKRDKLQIEKSEKTNKNENSIAISTDDSSFTAPRPLLISGSSPLNRPEVRSQTMNARKNSLIMSPQLLQQYQKQQQKHETSSSIISSSNLNPNYNSPNKEQQKQENISKEQLEPFPRHPERSYTITSNAFNITHIASVCENFLSQNYNTKFYETCITTLNNFCEDAPPSILPQVYKSLITTLNEESTVIPSGIVPLKFTTTRFDSKMWNKLSHQVFTKNQNHFMRSSFVDIGLRPILLKKNFNFDEKIFDNNLTSSTSLEIVNENENDNEEFENRLDSTIAPIEMPASRVKISKVINGTFYIFPQNLFRFISNEGKMLEILINDVITALPMICLQRQTAVEMITKQRKSFMFNFNSKKDLMVINQHVKIQFPTNEVLSNLTDKWVKRQITNFDYLTSLNAFSGRTFNSAYSYPVFPWILSDYNSPQLKLDNPSSYRDLSKPIGALNESRLEKLKALRDDNIDNQKFLYRSTYSCSFHIYHYMVRLEPFTSLHIMMQDGKFDVTSRLFTSIENSYNRVVSTSFNFRELIPEFFFCSEFLTNNDNIPLQSDIENVELPPYAKDPIHFIYLHRQALESEYVSMHLNEWIDLIWGYKQDGQAAEEADNAFDPHLYPNVWKEFPDPQEKEQIEELLKHVGQIPQKLFDSPHPKRSSTTNPPSFTISSTQSTTTTVNSEICCINKIQWTLHRDGKIYYNKNSLSKKVLLEGCGCDPSKCAPLKNGFICARKYSNVIYVITSDEQQQQSVKQSLIKRPQHLSPITSVCAIGSVIFSGDEDGIIVNDVASSPFHHKCPIVSMCGNFTLSVVVSLSADGNIVISNAYDLQFIRNIKVEIPAGFSPTKVVVCDGFGLITILALSKDKSKSFLATFSINGQKVSTSLLNIKIKHLVSATGTNNVDYLIANVDKGKIIVINAFELTTVNTAFENDQNITALTFVRDQNPQIYFGSSDGTLKYGTISI